MGPHIERAPQAAFSPVEEAALRELSSKELYPRLLSTIRGAGRPGSAASHAALNSVFDWMCREVLHDPFRKDPQGSAVYTSQHFTLCAYQARGAELYDFSNRMEELRTVLDPLWLAHDPFRNPADKARQVEAARKEYLSRIVNRNWGVHERTPFAELEVKLIEDGVINLLSSRESTISRYIRSNQLSHAQQLFEITRRAIMDHPLVAQIGGPLWESFENSILPRLKKH